jgi:dihydrofolate synthase/folylpolyglutamate synthase
VVQVAGTNGKGSTVAFLASMLSNAGVSIGAYTSPHLVRFAERFAVQGAPLPDAAIARAAARVDRADPKEELTFFEFATAIAACAFADAGIEIALLEVGMGGRFDATTAIGAQVAVVTGVALDHQAYLGHTIPEVAREKAGIFAAGQYAVIGASGEAEAVPLLVAAARVAGVSSIVQIDEPELARVPDVLGLIGPHQRANAASALAAVDGLERISAIAAVREEVRSRGLAQARLAGRLEWIGEVLLDGAHNPHAARALGRALAVILPGRPRILVFGASADKEVAEMALALAGQCDAAVTTAARIERALHPNAVADALRHAQPALPVETAATVPDALARAREWAARIGGAVVVTGSLYLVGEARAELLALPNDPFVLSDPVAPNGISGVP